MPTFDQPSPLTAASEAAGGVAQGLETAKSDQRADYALAQRDRELDIQQRTADANIQSQQLHDKIDQAVETFRAQCEPLLKQQLDLQVKGLATANSTAEITRKGAAIELQVQQWGMKQGIPQQLLKTSLDKAKADMVNAVKEGHLIDAQSNAANAQAGLTRAETAWGPAAGASGSLAAQDRNRILATVRQLELNPAFQKLPSAHQAHILKEVKEGVSLEAIRSEALAQITDPAMKQQVNAALGGEPSLPAPSAGGANPWQSLLQKGLGAEQMFFKAASGQF